MTSENRKSIKNTSSQPPGHSLAEYAEMPHSAGIAGLPPTLLIDSDMELLVVRLPPHGYEIDLERCNSASEMLDWIFQVHDKPWMTPELLAQVIQALENPCWRTFHGSVQRVFAHNNRKVNWARPKKCRE